MRIALIFFKESLEKSRKAHEISDLLLKTWIKFYERSGTTMIPCILIDKTTKIPSFWKYESLVLEDCNPPTRKDVLNKVGWMKSQSYNLLGDTVVMDLDAFIIREINELSQIDCKLAMAQDEGTVRVPWNQRWPEVRSKHNAGIMVFRSSDILPNFRKIWNKKTEFSNITYFDELIFSTLRDYSLSTEYNRNCANLEESKVIIDSPHTKILHFSGIKRKKALHDFCKIYS